MKIALFTNECQLRWEDNGLTIAPDAQLADFEHAVRVLARVGKISRIALGDLLTEASKKGLEEQLTIVFEEVGLTPVEVGKSLAIAAVPRSLRSEELSEEHYFVVSKLSLADQTKWLDAAIKHGLNALEMKRSIEAGRILKRDEINDLSGRGSGIINYHGIVNQWDRWANKIGGVTGMTEWPIETLRRWREEVDSVAEMIAKVDKILAEK
jgi:hypothetical protein